MINHERNFTDFVNKIIDHEIKRKELLKEYEEMYLITSEHKQIEHLLIAYGLRKEGDAK